MTKSNTPMLWPEQLKVRNAIRYDNVKQVWLCWGQRTGKTTLLANIAIPEFIMRSRKATRSLLILPGPGANSRFILKTAADALRAQGIGACVTDLCLDSDLSSITAINYDSEIDYDYMEDYRHQHAYDAIFLDEADWVPDPVKKLKIVKKALKPGGFLFVVSSPSSRNGLMMTAVTTLDGSPDVYRSHLSSWGANPTLYKTLFDKEYKVDYEGAVRDFGAYRE